MRRFLNSVALSVGLRFMRRLRVSLPLSEQGRHAQTDDFGAQWLAWIFPCRTLHPSPHGDRRMTRGRLVRYSLCLRLFHPLLISGFGRRCLSLTPFPLPSSPAPGHTGLRVLKTGGGSLSPRRSAPLAKAPAALVRLRAERNRGGRPAIASGRASARRAATGA